MGGLRHGHGAVRTAVCALAVALLLGTGRCSGPEADPREAEQAVSRLLGRRAAAVLAGDERRYLATVDPRDQDYRHAQRRVARNLGRVPVQHWSYALRDLTVHGRRAAAEVELRYRLTRHTRPPVRAVEKLALVRRDGRWYVTGERPGSSRQLWEQGRVRVVHGEHSLVLGTVDPATLRRIAARAERAVPAVSRSWPEAWSGHTVVLVPASVQDMAALLDGPVPAYAGIAAVTTGPAVGGAAGEWGRIVVNRQAFGLLSDRGRQVVMTHETAHVATRPHTGGATPLWLSEGLADWLGYRGTGSAPRAAAPTLAGVVRTGDAPRKLPADAEFGFSGSSDTLSLAYEGSWLACRMIADRWGPDRLAELYVAVGAAEGPQRAAVDRALRDVLGVDRSELIRMWRSYLRTQLTGA